MGVADGLRPWTRKRLAACTTHVLSGGAYKDVGTWTLDQEMRAHGDGTAATLRLAGIVHTGEVGGTASPPSVKFAGVQEPNRVDALEGRPPLTKWRISAIDNETGGSLSVACSDADCTAGDKPDIGTNTRRCYPQCWSPEGATSPKLDWFHNYVVTRVRQIDRTGGAPDEVTSYEYVRGAWHHDDDDGLTKEKYRTWSQWRGYGKVRVTHGEAPEQRSQSEYLYFRGMGLPLHRLTAMIPEQETSDSLAAVAALPGTTRAAVLNAIAEHPGCTTQARTNWNAPAIASRAGESGRLRVCRSCSWGSASAWGRASRRGRC